MLLNHSAYQKLVYERLDKLNLSIGQPKVLDFLYEHNGCMQKEIAHGCMIQQASVTSLLLKMEQEGYIRRVTENGNRRSLYVYLTEKGTQTARQVREVMAQTEEEALAGFGEEERETLLSMLSRINDYFMNM